MEPGGGRYLRHRQQGRAERAVLQELGHPTLLADGYRGRGRALIGPAVYPAWLATITLLLTVVPPLVAVIAVLVAVAEQESGAKVVVAGIGGAIDGAIQVVLWVTLAFAIVERADVDPGSLPLVPSRRWTPDDLPEIKDEGMGAGWGEGALMIAACTAGIVTAAFVMIQRRWTLRSAAANLASNIVFGMPIAWLLATRQLFHPDLVQSVLTGGGRDWSEVNHTVIIGILVVLLAWDSIDAYGRALRDRRR